MITAKAWAGKRYAVLGLARSGAATVDALLASGAEVVAWDEREEPRNTLLSRHAELVSASTSPQATESREERWTLKRVQGDGHLEVADILTLDLTGFAGVVVSPGVPLNRHPIAPHAAKFGVPVIGDIELFALARSELPPHKVVGITGTNGKSTTTALVYHILKTAGVPTTMGGNIGLPILAQEPLPEGGVYVLELSSFQIDLTYSLDCDVAVLLNITPDHLDRYESFEAYRDSKLRLFAMQSPDKVPVISVLNSVAAEFQRRLSKDRGYLASWTMLEASRPEWLALQGPHNVENIAAAVAACCAVNVERDVAFAALKTFSGLPHRMERVRERNGVLFVNDSKATNPDSAAPALAVFPAVHWIVGGQAKTQDLGPCEAQLGHLRGAYAIGEAGPMFVDLLRDRVPYIEDSQTLEKALTSATGRAKAGETVLLSPACASYDQFRDFEARGDAFRALVEGL